jgi:hypothetical protein
MRMCVGYGLGFRATEFFMNETDIGEDSTEEALFPACSAVPTGKRASPIEASPTAYDV